MIEQKVLVGDSGEVLKTLDAESIDLIVTDPPYGYSFMGKDWDRSVPSIDIWRECLRVLKPGAFAFIMSAPRMDVLGEMERRVRSAGFETSFTPLYWAYASGFPKAMNISKAVDKKLGIKGEIRPASGVGFMKPDSEDWNQTKNQIIMPEPTTPQAKALNGSYAGFQPKPAVEIIIVAMKPLNESNYVNQALANGKGITWLDDCRIPFQSEDDIEHATPSNAGEPTTTQTYGWKNCTPIPATPNPSGRFPANLLVSDDVLDDGFSRYFSLDKWAETLPFLIVPKASKAEKNKRLSSLPERIAGGMQARADGSLDGNITHSRNVHPTVKPVKLMSYLITLGSRPGDVVLDPFGGSGTTAVAARELGRSSILIELNPEYAEIIEERAMTNVPDITSFGVSE